MEEKKIEGKTLIAVYVEIGNLQEGEIDKYIKKFIKKSGLQKLEGFEDVMPFYIPIRGEKTRIEIIK